MRRACLVLLGCLVLSAWGQPPGARPEVIQPQHALPDQLVPAIEPLLKPGESVRAFRGRLILNVTPDTLTRVQRLLARIDTPPRNLLIAVRGEEASSQAARQRAVRARVSNEHASLSVNDPGPGENRVSLSAGRQQRQQTARDRQTVRAVEGYPAFVATGHLAPVTVKTPDGERAAVTRRSRGFFAVPRVQGDRVVLTIAPSRDRLDGSGTERAVTTVSGQLGEWIPVSGIDRQVTRETDAAGTAEDVAESHHGTVYVRVTEETSSP